MRRERRQGTSSFSREFSSGELASSSSKSSEGTQNKLLSNSSTCSLFLNDRWTGGSE
jgi:hypothetical protein